MSRFFAGLLIALRRFRVAQEKTQDKSITARTAGLQKMDGFVPLYGTRRAASC